MGRKSNLYMSEPKAWLNMLRISNAPTIVSNTMVGAALAIVAHQAEWEMHITAPPLQLAKPLIGIIIVLLLLYFAGMVDGHSQPIVFACMCDRATGDNPHSRFVHPSKRASARSSAFDVLRVASTRTAALLVTTCLVHTLE